MEAVYELMAILGLNKKPFDDGLNEARGDAEKGGSGIGKALGTAGKVAGAAIAAATTAVVGFGAASVSTGVDFDKSMSQVAATMGKTSEEMEDEVGSVDLAWGTFSGNLREYAQEMGSHTAFSATQAADALNYMALAGYDTQTAMEALPSVLNLAAAGNMDLATASDMVTDAQTALGIEIQDLNGFVDQLAKTSSTTNTSVAQVGDALLTVGATARNVAGGTTELNTVLGILADNGIKGSEAGTHLRNILLKMNPDTDKAVAAWEQLNVQAYDAQGNLRPLPEIFQELGKAMEGMTDQEKTQIISDMFKETDLAAVNALLGTQAERWNDVTAAVDGASGAAQKMADTQLDNLAGDVTLFKSALEGAQIVVSDQLTPTLRKFVQFGTEGLSELTNAFLEDGLGGAMEALSGIIDEGVGLLFDVLPTVVDAGIALLEGLISGILKNLPKLVDAAVKIITTLVKDLADNVDKVIDAAVEIIFALADGLIEALPKLIPAVVEIILKIVEKLTDPETLSKLIDASFKILGALAEGLIKAIPELLKSAPVIIKNLVEAIISFVPEMIKGGEELVKGIAEGILGMVDAAIDSVKELLGKIKDAILGVVDRAKEWGADMIQNFTNGIKSKVSGVVSAVSGIASRVKSFLGFSEPEEGPLSNFSTYAPDMMKLFAQGIKDNEHLITDQIRSSFDFGSMTVGAMPSAGNTTNNYTITVNGIEELEDLLSWYNSRQVVARMA